VGRPRRPRFLNHTLELEVSDDGKANGKPRSSGHGLVGMRERVALYGGELTAGPKKEGGFSVRARLPLESVAP
jgi:signal transduction histidine kinase